MSEYLELLDWRRRVAELWAGWRAASARDPAAAALAFRAARDRLFREHPQSPLPAARRLDFAGLAYWPYDEAWRISARLERDAGVPGPHADTPSAPDLPWSGPPGVALRRIGTLQLSGPLTGRRLGAYWLEGYAGGLFVAFRDATSGVGTYGAGRYLLDTAKGADHGPGAGAGDELLLDFNMAYHPSCAYDPRWSCPLAPLENRLDLSVTVGERLPG